MNTKQIFNNMWLILKFNANTTIILSSNIIIIWDKYLGWLNTRNLFIDIGIPFSFISPNNRLIKNNILAKIMPYWHVAILNWPGNRKLTKL